MAVRSATRVAAGVCAVIAGLVAPALPALPAQAAPPVVREVFRDVATGERFTGCPGLTGVTTSRDVRVSFVLRSRGREGLLFGLEHVRGTESWTRDGSTWAVSFTVVSKDLKVTDNDDGTLTVLFMATGSARWTLDRKLVYSNPGQVRLRVVVDAATGRVLSEQLVKGSTGRNDGPPGSLCDDLRRFLA